MSRWFFRPYVLTAVVVFILTLVGVAVIYPLATGNWSFRIISHISFTPDGSKLVVSQGERNWDHDYAQTSELIFLDTVSWKPTTRVGKGILLTPPQTVGHLRKSKGFITITREPIPLTPGAPFYFPFPAFSANAYAVPNSAGQPHVLIHWDDSGNIKKRVRLTSKEIPGMEWYHEVSDLAIDSEDNIAIAGTTFVSVICWGLKNLVAAGSSWALNLRSEKPAWVLDKGYPQAKASPDGKTCLCCRTSCPLPYKTAGKPDLTAELKLFEFSSGKLVAELRSDKFEPLFANWWGDKDKVLLLTNSRKLVLLTKQLNYEKELVQSKIGERPIQLTTDAKGNVVVIADPKRIEIYSGKTWELQHCWEVGKSEQLTAAACSPDGKHVVWAVTRHGSFRITSSFLYIYDTEAKKILTVIR